MLIAQGKDTAIVKCELSHGSHTNLHLFIAATHHLAENRNATLSRSTDVH